MLTKTEVLKGLSIRLRKYYYFICPTGVNQQVHNIFKSYTLSSKAHVLLLALQPPLEVVFYSPLVGFSLLACEVS